MKNLKTRLSIILVGFLVLVIPLLFLCYNLDKLYSSTKDIIQENLRRKLLKTANELQKNTDPAAYLNIEISKIHKQLFPEAPEEIIKNYPDKVFFSKLYSKTKFEQLLSYTLEKYEPIMITMSDEALTNTFSYFSEDLKKQIPTETEQKKLLIARNYFDYNVLRKNYSSFYNSNPENISQYNPGFTKDLILTVDELKDYCFKYLSRYNDFEKFLEGSYSDYFGKQIIYATLKTTFSRYGIHGCYSLLVPQKAINPDDIIKTAIGISNSDVNIELTSANFHTKLEETEHGLNYYINLPTNFINQVKTFKNLNNIDKSHYLKESYKLSVLYPQSLLKHAQSNLTIKVISIFIIILYLFLSIFFLIKKNPAKISLTNKLALVLSIILFTPVIGTSISIWISTQNLDKIINNNVEKNLHNELENLYIKNQENNRRIQSAIFEMKKTFQKKHVNPDPKSLSELFIGENSQKSNYLDWYLKWLAELILITDNGNVFAIKHSDNPQNNLNNIKYYTKKETSRSSFLISKYTENLGLHKNQVPRIGTKEYEKYMQYEMQKTYTLGVLEKYLNPELEAITAGQEGIQTKDLLSLPYFAYAIYYYAQDIDGKKYYIYHKSLTHEKHSFNYIDKYLSSEGHLCLLPQHRYSRLKLGISLNKNNDRLDFQRPRKINTSDDLNQLFQDTLKLQDNVYTNEISSSSNCIKECLFTEGDPFVVGGIAYADTNTNLTIYLSIIIPTLLAYSIILLVITTNFISTFIKQPIEIYNEAINKLENHEYGVTIKSFSKDEFENITTAFNEMSVALKQKEQIKRYVSDRLLKSINENNIQNAGEGKSEKVTILSSDIRNFTGISENHSPAEIVDMLNSYFTLMQQAISNNGGFIDKYIGDAIQAVFYYEPNKENPILRACKAALEMRKALSKLNKEREALELFTIENGIGIDSDIALIGTIGTQKGRKDYTVNGKVIDKAANLEAKTKGTTTKILISNASAKEIENSIISQIFDSESTELIDVK